MNKVLFSVFGALLWISCEVKPQEIAYNNEACHFCKMTIVDRQHSAQLVTVKGKAFKYDAIECMMNHLNKWEEPKVKFYLVADYSHPGSLIHAASAYFLISKQIPSPMGEFLTAFGNQTERDKIVLEGEGKGFDWVGLKAEFNVSD